LNTRRITELFQENLENLGELGASVSVWRRGEQVLSLAGGWRDRERTKAWREETPVLFWSATKGLTAACVLHALQEHSLDPNATRVAEVWPEFAQNGKDRVTIAELMSHQAGLSLLSQPVAVWDYELVVEALAAESPHWSPGQGHGYHPRTFGFLMDELIRRIAGVPVKVYWRKQFAEPLGIDVWIGVPDEMVADVAPVFPARTPPPKEDIFYSELFRSGSFTAQAFTSPRGLHSATALNQPAALSAGFPAFGGVGTAVGLAQFYGMLAHGGVQEAKRYFEPHAIDWMTTTLTDGADRVLNLETAFSCGFMRDPIDSSTGAKKRSIFGPSQTAFGHPGAGGSHAFADPENGIGFAYVMNQMEPGVLPNAKALRLVEALYDS
jgi:CubicO group peptidase (beta-lactamase class C family)